MPEIIRRDTVLSFPTNAQNVYLPSASRLAADFIFLRYIFVSLKIFSQDFTVRENYEKLFKIYQQKIGFMKKCIVSIVLALFAAIISSGCTEEQKVEVTDFKLDKTSVELRIDETSQLLAVITPQEAAQNGTVTWSSSDENVATVSNEGLVTAVAIGETVITARFDEFTAECNVSVVTVAVESVQLNKIELTLVKGESETLQATISPEDADNVEIKWTSSDEEVATVSSEGEVTAVNPGEAVISATAGGITATCNVEVLPQEVQNVTLDQNDIEIIKGESMQLTATIEPEGTGAVVEWTTDDYYVASVAQDGTVTGEAVGEVTITATAGGKSASCTVTVLPVEATSITLNPTEVSLAQGESATITATVEPENYDGTIEWTSDNTDVAVVSINGEVTAVGNGTATITASVGTVSANCTVTVATISSLNIGDFYYSDGTWSQELDPDKTPIGIVFYVGNPTSTDPTLAQDHPECTHGYVIALQNCSDGAPFAENYDAYVAATQSGDIAGWLLANAPQYQTINMSDNNLDRLSISQGYNNTAALEFFNESYPEYTTIAKYAVEYRNTCPAPDNSSDWYVPSPKELSLLFIGEWDGDLMSIDILIQGKTNYRDMINNKISQIEGASLLHTDDVSYWSSSVAGVPTAFTMSAAFGWISLNNINGNNIVRCVLAF